MQLYLTYIYIFLLDIHECMYTNTKKLIISQVLIKTTSELGARNVDIVSNFYF